MTEEQFEGEIGSEDTVVEPEAEPTQGGPHSMHRSPRW